MTFFVNKLDERVMSALRLLVPVWTEEKLDEIRKIYLHRPDTHEAKKKISSSSRHTHVESKTSLTYGPEGFDKGKNM